ncbi:hypothetical protein IGI04_019678, partial [Brassica rapa subsp. trilocularis]
VTLHAPTCLHAYSLEVTCWSQAVCFSCLQLSSCKGKATPYDIKYPLLSSGRPVTARKTIENSERKRERREKNLELSTDEPFSPSCDFNQCVLVWLRAEGLVFKSLESPKFFSLGFYRRVSSLKFISTKFILKLEEIVLNIIKYGSINHVKFYYKLIFQNIPV